MQPLPPVQTVQPSIPVQTVHPSPPVQIVQPFQPVQQLKPSPPATSFVIQKLTTKSYENNQVSYKFFGDIF